MNNERNLAKEITEGFEALKSIRNNEPVAWTSQDVLDADHIIKAVVRREQDEQHTIPLYTHSAKTLTDEEIAKYVKEWKLKELKENSSSTNYVQELAFIDGLTWTLRKAQEK
jgi:hypothetical protein